MLRTFALALLALTVSCAGSANEPADVAKTLFEAVRDGDEAGIGRTLSAQARTYMKEEGSGFSFKGESLDAYEIGVADIQGDLASVPVHVTTEGEEKPMSLKMRRDDGQWVVTGMAVAFGGGELPIDFEGGMDDFFGGAVEGIANEMANELASGMQEAFTGAMSDWENGGSEEDIAAARQLFEELRTVDVVAHDAAWKIDVSGAGRPARQVLAELTGPDLRVDEGVHAAHFDRTTGLDFHGISRLEAIESLTAELGLHPVYPTGVAWGDEIPALTFTPAETPRSVAFAGPFSIEVEELIENAPHATGELTLTVRALGLAPAVVAANREMAQVVDVAELESAAGEHRADPDMQYLGTPAHEHGMLVDRTSFDLVGLLSGVETLTIAGKVSIALPADVGQVRIAPFVEGQWSAGPWTVKATTAGEQNHFELAREGGVPESVRFAFAPDDAGGRPLGILFSTTNAWGDDVSADLQTPAMPAALGIKVFDAQTASYAFNIEVPLARFSEQPSELAALAFDGDAPVGIRFRGFGDRSNPEFPEVQLSIENRSNKAAERVQATFEYTDAGGRVLESFPHTLTGEFTHEGHQPVAEAHATEETDEVAFFMPKTTQGLRVQVEQVEFVDGTRWERE